MSKSHSLHFFVVFFCASTHFILYLRFIADFLRRIGSVILLLRCFSVLSGSSAIKIARRRRKFNLHVNFSFIFLFSASKAKNTGPVKTYVEIYTVFSYCFGKIEVYNALLRVLYPGSLL